MIYVFVFLLSCFYLHIMYASLNQYGSFTPYVTKNFMKSLYLLILFIFASLFIVPFEQLNNNTVKIVASLYVSNDFMGLLKVKLSYTTILHHIVSCILLVYSWNVDFNTNNVAKCIFMYTYLSAANFGVNLYLALRFMGDFEWLKHCVRIVYAITFVVNVVLQCCMLDRSTSGAYLYTLLMTMVVIDDIMLLRWLYDYNR